jgi:hypothetical protein
MKSILTKQLQRLGVNQVAAHGLLALCLSFSLHKHLESPRWSFLYGAALLTQNFEKGKPKHTFVWGRHMVTEIVEFVIKSECDSLFEADMASAKTIISRAKGFIGMEVMRSIENPETYRLLVT